jgi:hypothetical protein
MDGITEEKLLELLANLIGAVEKAAPVVWQLAIRQAYVDGAKGILAFAVFAAVAIIAYRIGRNSWTKGADAERYSEQDDLKTLAMLSWMVSVVSSLGSFLCLIEAINPLLNPGYYAIKLLIKMATGQELP